MTGQPTPPEDVRVEYDDGQPAVPCELVYDGQDDDGLHVWRAVLPVGVFWSDLIHGRAHVRVGMLPARTRVTVPLAMR